MYLERLIFESMKEKVNATLVRDRDKLIDSTKVTAADIVSRQ